jgi:hypothetical protein
VRLPIKCALLCIIIFGARTFVHAHGQTIIVDPCKFPPGLREVISQKYLNSTIVALADMDEYDRKLYQKDHRTGCPGLLPVNFYGDGQPTWALVLKAAESGRNRAELIVVRHSDKGWEIRSLERTDSKAPVVWSERPGKYEDVYRENAIRAKWPVIVFCQYESWAILYAWTGKGVEKIWIAD